MTSFFSRFRAVLVAFTAFVTLVSADHDLNMQCKVKVKPVAIDTPDENGGLARTSFLYVEVEADQKIYVEPESCPEGYVPPMTVYEINYASGNEHQGPFQCPEPWDSNQQVTCDVPSDPADYEDFLQNPAKYSCSKVTRTWNGNQGDTQVEVQCNMHSSDWTDGVCCPPDKPTLYMRQPTHDEWMNSGQDHPVLKLGRCTAASFGPELYGNKVDLTAIPFDTSDRVSPVRAERMDGYEGRDGPYTIKDVYKKFGQRAKSVLRHSFWPALTAPDKVIKVTGMKDTTRDDVINFFDSQEMQWSECNGPGPDSCIQRSESVRSMGGCVHAYDDPEDPDVAYFDFPQLENYQVYHVLSHIIHSTGHGGTSDADEMMKKIKFGYKKCNAAMKMPSALGMPPLARDNIAGYFTHFHNDPVPGNKQILSSMKRTPFKSAVSKEFTVGGVSSCKMLVTLLDVPKTDPQELVSVDGVKFSDLLSIYHAVPDAYVALDAFTVLARTTGKVPGLDTKFTVEVRDPTSGAVTKYTNITATPDAYGSLKAKLDARNDKRWDENFKCGGMDNDRDRGKIKLNDKRFERESTYDVSSHIDLTSAKGGRDDAISGMKEDALSFAFYLGSRNLETGKQSQTFREDNQLWSSNNEELTVNDFEGCNVVVAGCYGEGTGIPLEMAENKCDVETLSVVVDGLNRTMELTEDGKMLTNYVDYLQYMGTDAWVDCASIVTNSMADAYEEVSMETMECVYDHPCDWMSADGPQNNETTRKSCNQGHEGFCKDNPNHVWCNDPCCNTRLQETMCCAPKNATVSVFKPKFKTEDYVLECLTVAFENSKTEASPGGNIDSLACVDPTEATAAADFVAKKLQDPRLCMTKYLEVNKITTEINSDLECCLNAVVGKESWENGYSMKSTQPCSTDDDCESGKCVITTGDQKDAPKDQLKDPCKWTTVEHPNRCAIAGADTSGTSIAKCLLRRLTTNPKVTEEAVKTVQKVLGGSSDASDADVGKTIMAGALTNTCMGDGNAHLFDQYCWGSACSDCEGDTECKAACEGVKACNWKPRSHNQTACDAQDWDNCHGLTSETVCNAATGNFCLGTTDWGSSEDLTQAGYCRTSTPTVYGNLAPYDMWLGWRHQGTSDKVNNTFCGTVATNLGLSSADLTATKDPSPWYSDANAYQCTFSGTNMNSDKDTCYAACTSGFKPTAQYQCYVDINATTGKCPTSGFFTVRHEDWDFHPPEGVSRPSFCVSEPWGPNNLYDTYGAPDWNNALTGTAQTNAGWRLTVAGDGTGSGAPPGYAANHVYNLAGTEWEDVTKYDWGWGFTFADETIAEKICTDSNVGAKVRTKDDGTERCREDVCWFDTTGVNSVTTQSDCDNKAKAPSGATAGFYTNWEKSYNSGNGVCIFRPWNIRPGSGEQDSDYWTWTNGFEAAKKFKAVCAAEAANGANFYAGRVFSEGVMDSEVKCNAKYCNIVGKNTYVDNATCTSLGGVCKTKGLGCGGCRKPSKSEVSSPKEGMCYRTNVASAGDCTGHYVSTMRLCLYNSTTSANDCSSPNAWVTCSEIDDDVCGAATPDTSKVHGIASSFLECKATKDKRFCKSKEQCEAETGSCSSHWGPQLKEEICEWNSTSSEEDCTPYANVCITPMDMTSNPPKCPGHTCVGNPNAYNATYTTVNSTGHSIEVTELVCWDSKREHVTHDRCADYHVTSESECTALKGQWLSTNITSQKAFCTSNAKCVGGRTETGWTGERDADQCTLCGGRMVSEASWEPGVWTLPAMVDSGNQWKTRGYLPGVNTWGSRVDTWRVKDFVTTVETSLREAASSVFARCQYGQVGESLKQLASVCSGLSFAERTKILDAASKLLNNLTAFNGTDMTLGNAGDTNLQPDANSTDGDASYSVDTAIVRVPTDNETLAAACMGTVVSNSADSSVAPVTSRRRTSRRRLSQAEADAATLQDAGCWSRVRNSNDALVGMLLGECIQVSLGAGQQLLDGVKACLKTKPDRAINADYTQDIFVKRTTVNGVEKYTPMSTITVERVGTQICGKVTDVGSFFCPARVAPNWATATTDIGSTECPIVDVIGAAKSAAIETIRNRNKASGEEDGPLPGLDPASGIAVLAVMCLFICGCCVGCRWLVVRRRRRQQAAAGKAMVVHNTLIHSQTQVVQSTAQP